MLLFDFISYIMNKEKDHQLEAHWKDYKEFLRKLEREFQVIKNYIDVDKMSENLNCLKYDSRFVDIERTIEKYMIHTGWGMIKNYEGYYFNLYHTQLKQWKKIPSIVTDKLVTDTYFKHFDDNIFNLYMNLATTLNGQKDMKYKLLFGELHIPDYDDPNNVVECNQYNKKRIYDILPDLIEKRNQSAMTVITRYLDISEKIFELYDIEIPKKMDGRKVLILIDKLENKK